MEIIGPELLGRPEFGPGQTDKAFNVETDLLNCEHDVLDGFM